MTIYLPTGETIIADSTGGPLTLAAVLAVMAWFDERKP